MLPGHARTSAWILCTALLGSFVCGRAVALLCVGSLESDADLRAKCVSHVVRESERAQVCVDRPALWGLTIFSYRLLLVWLVPHLACFVAVQLCSAAAQACAPPVCITDACGTRRVSITLASSQAVCEWLTIAACCSIAYSRNLQPDLTLLETER